MVRIENGHIRMICNGKQDSNKPAELQQFFITEVTSMTLNSSTMPIKSQTNAPPSSVLDVSPQTTTLQDYNVRVPQKVGKNAKGKRIATF
jgi:hypothetical protein